MIKVLAALLGLLLLGCGDEPVVSSMPIDGGPPVDCVAIPAATCQTIVNDARSNAEPGTIPIRIRAICTRPPCTIQRGEVEATVQYSNGRTDTYGMAWEGAGP
jgi:hypothetical protein